MQTTVDLQAAARDIRAATIRCIGALGVGHIGGSMSICEALSALYYGVMKTDAANPQWEERDYFVLSKGHAGPALYATLALKGFFPMDTLDTLNVPGTMLPSHCDRLKTPGVDISAGSLGQGIGVAVGLALSFKLANKPNRVYCIVGDGESNEGSVWEAAMAAANFGLDNFTVLFDDNKLQSDGFTADVMMLEPIVDKWASFNFDAQRVPGHDANAIYAALIAPSNGKPKAIILDTVKGKGWPPFEGVLASHNSSVTPEQVQYALSLL